MHSIRCNTHLSNHIFGRYSLLLFLGKPYLAKKECIICQKNKTSSTGSGYKELTECTTDAAANSIITHVNNTDDLYGKTQLMNYSTSDIIAREFWYHRSCLREITRQKIKKNEENKEKNDADEFRQQCFESLMKYVEEKIISEGQFLRMITIANYYRQLQESIKLQVKGGTPRNIKSRLIHAFEDKLSFFQKSSRTGEIVFYDIDYREKVFIFGEQKN